MSNLKEGVEPDRSRCDKCGSPMVIKFGQVRPVPRLQRVSGVQEHARAGERPRPTAEGGEIEENCENCGKPMVLKRGRFGQFLACTGYPECKTTRKIIATKQGLAAAKPDRFSTRSARSASRTW